MRQPDDYLDAQKLRVEHGLDDETIRRLLDRWGLGGHGRLCIEADRLEDYLGILELEDGQA